MRPLMDWVGSARVDPESVALYSFIGELRSRSLVKKFIDDMDGYGSYVSTAGDDSYL